MSQQVEPISNYAPVDHASAWRSDNRDRDSFVVQLQAHHLTALDQALQTAKQISKDAESITLDDFRLREIEVDIAAWRDEVM